MPFTPFHFGPGILLKSVLRKRFSLIVFCLTQIIIDIQPLVVMLSGKGRVHGFTHTYIGATLIAILSGTIGKYLFEWVVRNISLTKKFKIEISWKIAFLSSFIGAYSHIVLDSIMHSDIEPFAPFVLTNSLFRLVSIESLYIFCFYCGVFGAIIYIFSELILRFRNEK